MTSMSPLLNEILTEMESDARARVQPHRAEAIEEARHDGRRSFSPRGVIASGLARVALLFDAAAARRTVDRRGAVDARTAARTGGF